MAMRGCFRRHNFVPAPVNTDFASNTSMVMTARETANHYLIRGIFPMDSHVDQRAAGLAVSI